MKAIILASLSLLIFTSEIPNKKKCPSGEFVFIPAGSTIIAGQSLSLDAYWISDREVSNCEYNAFLEALKEAGKDEEYAICRIANDKWITETSEFNEPYSTYYSTHPAYENYPVVNISHEAALLYCEWLTENSKEKNINYRLPSRIEWIYAARGGLDIAEYAWGGPYLRNKKGEYMCNFRMIGDEFIHVNDSNRITVAEEFIKTRDLTTITAPVDSYWPNEYGLYNACGNVAEMIDVRGVAMGGSWNDTGYDVRIESEKKYTDPSPFIGFRVLKEELPN